MNVSQITLRSLVQHGQRYRVPVPAVRESSGAEKESAPDLTPKQALAPSLNFEPVQVRASLSGSFAKGPAPSLGSK